MQGSMFLVAHLAVDAWLKTHQVLQVHLFFSVLTSLLRDVLVVLLVYIKCGFVKSQGLKAVFQVKSVMNFPKM